MTGALVLLGTLVLGLLAGRALKRRDGRIRPSDRAEPVPASTLPAPVSAALEHGAPVTLVQISTTFCAPCRHTRVLLSALAERTAGLRHVDVDVTDQPEVARHLGILRTPTTLAFAPDGRELLRVGGVPAAAALADALRTHLP